MEESSPLGSCPGESAPARWPGELQEAPDRAPGPPPAYPWIILYDKGSKTNEWKSLVSYRSVSFLPTPPSPFPFSRKCRSPWTPHELHNAGLCRGHPWVPGSRPAGHAKLTVRCFSQLLWALLQCLLLLVCLPHYYKTCWRLIIFGISIPTWNFAKRG